MTVKYEQIMLDLYELSNKCCSFPIYREKRDTYVSDKYLMIKYLSHFYDSLYAEDMFCAFYVGSIRLNSTN